MQILFFFCVRVRKIKTQNLHQEKLVEYILYSFLFENKETWLVQESYFCIKIHSLFNLLCFFFYHWRILLCNISNCGSNSTSWHLIIRNILELMIYFYIGNNNVLICFKKNNVLICLNKLQYINGSMLN